jgi:hypothetical protein
MHANNLRQKDLAPIFGSESIVTEVLHKKRALNRTHIEKLSRRFQVSQPCFPKTFAQLAGICLAVNRGNRRTWKITRMRHARRRCFHYRKTDYFFGKCTEIALYCSTNSPVAEKT